jgi:hypothetical protein
MTAPEQAFEALKLDPRRPVQARVDGLTVELRGVAAPAEQAPRTVVRGSAQRSVRHPLTLRLSETSQN